MEGGFYGVPSVAVSTSRENEAAHGRRRRAGHARAALAPSSGLAPGAVVNVNIPPLSDAEPDVRLTSQARVPMTGGIRALPGAARARLLLPGRAKRPAPAPPGSDVAALEAGAISVTPLRRHLTDEAVLPRLKSPLTRSGQRPMTDVTEDTTMRVSRGVRAVRTASS